MLGKAFSEEYLDQKSTHSLTLTIFLDPNQTVMERIYGRKPEIHQNNSEYCLRDTVA